MSQYNVGDEFVIRIKSIPEPGLYQLSEKLYMNESSLDELRRRGTFSIAEIKEDAYEQGLNDAWEIAKKLTYPTEEGGIGVDTRCGLFGDSSILRVMYRFSFGEIKGIIDKYEERKKIKEGDIIEILEQKAVVLAIDGELASVYVVDNDDGKVQEVELHRLKKVGPSIDVKETLLNECVAATCRHEKELRESV